MDDFFAGVWLGLRTLVTKPLQYLTNPIEATTATYKEDLEEEGLSMSEVDQRVKSYEDSGGPLTGISKGVNNLLHGVGNLFTFLTKNLTTVLIVAVIIVIGWYFLMFRKAVTE